MDQRIFLVIGLTLYGHSEMFEILEVEVAEPKIVSLITNFDFQNLPFHQFTGILYYDVHVTVLK